MMMRMRRWSSTDDSDWRPVHTPRSEVLELAACEANAAYAATLARVAPDGVTLTDSARGELAAFVQRQTRTPFSSAYMRLKRVELRVIQQESGRRPDLIA